MDFNLDEEQQILDETVRNFFAHEYSFETRRTIMASTDGWSRKVWAQCAELGLLGIGVPQACGGLDAGAVATMLVMNAIGSRLVLEPFLPSAVVATALLRYADDSDHRAALLPAMAEGRTLATLAHQEADMRGPWAEPSGSSRLEESDERRAPTGESDERCARTGESDKRRAWIGEQAVRPAWIEIGTRARRTAGGYVLHGHKPLVPHAEAADVLIVSARVASDPGASLFRVPRAAPGVTLDPYKSLDGQRAADVDLAGVELPLEARIGPEGAGGEALERAHEAGLAAVCAEAVGAMKALIDATAEYLKTRRQFGRPIGRFQALQHRAADMLIHYEQAKSMSHLATLRCSDPDPFERRRALSAAKVIVGRACRFVGQQAVQLHGGMGMTDELDVSHYFKRLTAIELTFGDAALHLDRFMRSG